MKASIKKGSGGSVIEGELQTLYKCGRIVWVTIRFPGGAGCVDWSLVTGLPNDKKLREQGWSLTGGTMRALRCKALVDGLSKNPRWEREVGL